MAFAREPVTTRLRWHKDPLTIEAADLIESLQSALEDARETAWAECTAAFIAANSHLDPHYVTVA